MWEGVEEGQQMMSWDAAVTEGLGNPLGRSGAGSSELS